MRRLLLGSISVSYDVWLPYGAGSLISYALHHADTHGVVFDEPLYKWLPDDQLADKLRGVDLLALTCYVWNQDYNDHIATVCKQINPHVKVLYGGPNIPLDKALHADFAAAHSAADAFIAGPGEQAFCDIISKIDDDPALWPHCFGLGFDNSSGRLSQPTADNMPQPYLDGVFDSILAKETAIKASFETNRGCPFRCAFCDWGGQANSRVIKFDMPAVQATIDYLYAHANIREIEILDANFGMHRRDLETVRSMLAAKQRTGNNPSVSYSGLVKNGSPHLAEIIRIIHNDLGAQRRHLKLSFQSHSKQTLDVMLRDNIDNTHLLQLLHDLRADGISVSSEMIIGMPGETAESWLSSQSVDYAHGIGFMRTYLLNVVTNTVLYQQDFREQHGIKTKTVSFPYANKSIDKRVLLSEPDLRVHGDKHETYEIVYQCHSFDLSELRLMFRYFWYYHNFYNSKALRGTIAHLASNGHDIAAQAHMFYDNLYLSPLLERIICKQDDIISQLFKPEQHTVIDSYAAYRFFAGSLRTDDLYQLCLNRESVVSDLIRMFSADAVLSEVIRADVASWISPDVGQKELAKRLLSHSATLA